ncbi:hypothetical protein KJ940_02585, partial [Myxococcota bacterium]|nr:hypothetical protein [Myxococcota bacterium]
MKPWISMSACVLAFWGCTGGLDDEASPCDPGATAACRCLSGAEGVQVCDLSASWGLCACDDAGGVPWGGEAGSGGGIAGGGGIA